MHRLRLSDSLCALVILFWLGASSPASAANPLSWPALSSQTRPWVWWWWPGSAVDTNNLARELRLFRNAGLGGVQITPIYGAKGWEGHYLTYLSPQWVRMMGYTVRKARRLGLGVDMTLGTGWCFGGPTVNDQEANASVVLKSFQTTAGERLKQEFDPATTQALVAFSPDGKAVDLTDRIADDGSLAWAPPADSWRVYAISQRPSGQRVKRAAPGGEGWMLNPAYARAMRDWLRWFDPAFDDYHGPKPQGVFQDSYEYRTDWAPDFFAQFERLRHYRLQTVLPTLFGDRADEETARVKSDYRRTISDLMVEESEPIWVNWSHRHGFATIYQAHGTPGNWLDLYAEADIPETEMFHLDRNPLISKFASSAAHVVGRKLVAAETGTWLGEHFTVTLAQLKSLADKMFLSGVNHIYYHGCCYSPAAASWPGWLFYAATEMNPRNSIWRDVPTLNDYVARCQAVLQSGRPDNEILLYWPISDFWNNPKGLLPEMSVSRTDWFDHQPIGAAARLLWKQGFTFDYISDRQLQRATVEDHQVRMPGGRYRVVIVPECELMPLKTLRRLGMLAKSGATVIFEDHLPADVPGWGHLKRRRRAFEQLTNRLASSALASASGSPGRMGTGRILVGDLRTQLRSADCLPEEMAALGLRFVRRAFDGGWYYFIANGGEKSLDTWVTLSRPAQSVAILDSMTGRAGLAEVRFTGGRPQVRLQLPPGRSLILKAFAKRVTHAPAWSEWRTHGAAIRIQGQWRIKFTRGGPVLPASFQATRLASWTQLGDTNAQRFAGTAVYSIVFDAPHSKPGQHYFLDLGKVCQSARVRLNGKEYGTLIAAPFRVVVDHLKPRANRLEVQVTNLSANRIRDLDRRHVRWKYFHNINFVNIDYRPFDASNWPLADSGLLGPVTLTAAKAERTGGL